MIRHHRLLELFLVENLGMGWDEVHAEAEVLEHVLSEELEELIAAKLGNPTLDPHGDPIPSRDLAIADDVGSCDLYQLEPGSSGTFVRVSDADPEMLRFLTERGIRPGARLDVLERQPFDGPLLGPRRQAGARARRSAGPRNSGADAAVSKLASGRAREGDLVDKVLPGEAATLRAAQEALDGRRTGLRALWPFLGPAFIASVAYLDPGNFATDVAAGAKYGYLLLWAVLGANLMAMVVQTLSAKLGIATGRNLAEVCRDNFPRRVSFGLWVQAEVIAMATDLAEVLGAALGLSLLFGIPLGWGAVIAVCCAFAILALQRPASGASRP